MTQLTDTEKLKVCGLILADVPLPAQWQERLFPSNPKPPETGKTTTEAPAQTPEQKMAYTIEEAAALLSMKVCSIRKFIVDGRLRRVPSFRHVIITAKELERFAKASE